MVTGIPSSATTSSDSGLDRADQNCIGSSTCLAFWLSMLTWSSQSARIVSEKPKISLFFSHVVSRSGNCLGSNTCKVRAQTGGSTWQKSATWGGGGVQRPEISNRGGPEASVPFFRQRIVFPSFCPWRQRAKRKKNGLPHKHHSHACTRNKGVVGREGNGEGAKGTGKGKGGGGTVTVRWRGGMYRTTQRQKR